MIISENQGFLCLTGNGKGFGFIFGRDDANAKADWDVYGLPLRAANGRQDVQKGLS
jgi:hypothetical protein